MGEDLDIRRYRSIFISDLHLGTRGCQAELLLDFIKVAKDAIFRDGRLLEISIWNAIRWWRFAKLAHSFVKTIIDVWKEETKQADAAGV